MTNHLKDLFLKTLLLLTVIAPVAASAFYDPELGCFVQPDTTIPNTFDPQSLNRYAYVRNNPLKYVDPTGHSWLPFWENIKGQQVLDAQVRAHTEYGSYKEYMNARNNSVPTAGDVSAVSAVAHTAGAATDTYINVAQEIATAGIGTAVTAVTALERRAATAGAETATEKVGQAAALPALGKVGIVAKGAEGTTPLYRAVMNEELKDITSSGILRNPAGIENKYFSTTAEGAASYGKKAFGKMGDTSPYTIIKTETPNSFIPKTTPVDRNIPAVTIPTSSLNQLKKPQILPYAPIPD